MDFCSNLAAPVVTEVLKCCILERVKRVYSLIKNHKSNLNQLQDKHDRLYSIKDDIARKVEDGKSRLEEVTSEARVWLESVETLLEDEQVKDLMNEEFRRAKHKCCFGLVLCNLYQHYGMGRLATAKADEMQQKLDQRPQDPVTDPIRTMDLEPIPTGHCKALKTREEVEQRILELLKDDQVDAVGICGMGGIGKTTLAKEIKNKGAEDMFDRILMVEISQEANIRRIQDELAASLDLPLNSQLSLAERATWLYNALKKAKPKQSNKNEPTKMLIILDNIWKDLELHELGIPYPHEKTTQFCCKLLFTSRDMNICKSMSVPDKNIVQVKTLNDDESKSLFWEKVGNNEDDDQGKRSLEHELLDSCGGLPLAIIALARMLRGKNVERWKYYANELQKPISCQSDGVYDTKTYKILELSFEAIRNDEMKRFFLLACLFPNDLLITIEELMRHGIGLDLFPRANFLSEAMSEATMWAEELISSSLLLSEPIGINGFTERLKIHDVVRSYAISFAEKRGNRLIVGAIPQLQMDRIVQECTAISIRDDEDFSWPNGMDLNRLEMLMIYGSHRPFELDDAFFMRIVRLQVLDSTKVNFIRLPKSITNLTSLKTLQLDYCSLRDEDMELISELVELRVLSLRWSNVKMLPYEMTKLINLRLLDLTGCEELRTIPANVIGGLTKLEELYMKNKYSSWQNSEEQESGEASLAELNSLRRLKVLQIDVPKIEQLQISDEFFTSLHSFDMCVGNKLRYGRSGYELEAGLSGEFMVEFECLEWVFRYPRLMERLCKSDYLKVDGKTIKDDDKGKDVVSYLNKERFSDLKRVELRNLKGLMRIYDERQVSAGMLSKLEHLSLHKLDNLESYVFPIDAAPNLTTLEVKDCKKLKFIWMDLEQGGKSKSSMAMKIKELPYLKKLQLKDLPQLQDVLGEVQGSTSTDVISTRVLFSKIIFSSMEELHIDDIGEYVKLWDIPDTMEEMWANTQLQNLKSLSIMGSYELTALTPFIANALVQLQSLTIARCPNMREVISKETKETEISSKMIIFSKLTKLHLAELYQLECFYRGSYELQFPALKEMYMSGLGNCQRLFVEQENSQGVFPKKIIFSSMEELHIDDIGEYVKLWDIPDTMEKMRTSRQFRFCNQLQNLKSLTIRGSYELKALTPSIANALVQLQSLTIEFCSNMKEVISKETEDTEISSKMIIFSKLTKLDLGGLDQLECFYRGSYELQFPALEAMSLRWLRNYKRLFVEQENSQGVFPKKTEFPCLERLFLRRVEWNMVDSVGYLDVEKVNLLKSLKHLTLSDVEWKHIFLADAVASSSLERLRQLESLTIEDCKNIEAVIEIEPRGQQPQQEEAVVVDDDDDESGAGATISMPSPSLYLQFPRLRFITLQRCKNLRWFISTKIGTGTGHDHVNVVVDLPSLEYVLNKHCPKMEEFSSRSITLKAPNLSLVEVTRRSTTFMME